MGTAKLTDEQLELLAQMTAGGKTLHAGPTPRGGASYTLRSADDYDRVAAALVKGLEARGLIERIRTSDLYAMRWTYRVTSAGRACLAADGGN